MSLLRNCFPGFFLSLLLLLNYATILAQEGIPRELEGFEEYAEKARKDWGVPGFAVAVVKGQELVYAKGFGLRNLEKELPVTENTLFAIGSTTKAMTAVIVCQLVDEGLVELDKPVVEYLPEFKMYDDYVTRNITPRDLMCHRSGLPRHDLAWYGSERNREELVEAIRYLEPNKSFREAYQYQNLMYMTAGYLTGKLSGKPWEQIMRERLFNPLEMSRSNLSVSDSQNDADYSLPYTEIEEEIVQIPFRNLDAIGPAGSVNSSVKEMANWLIMQINGGKFKDTQITSSSMLQEIHSPQMALPGRMSEEVFYSTYGLGWVITSYRGHARLSHGGGIDGFITQVAFYPQDSVGVVVLTNLSGGSLSAVIRNAVADRMLGLETIDWNQRLIEQRNKAKEAQEQSQDEEDSDRIKGTSPSHELKAYTGKFRHPGYGTINISEKDGQLQLSYHTFDLPMHHYHYDVFEIKSPIIDEQKFIFHTNEAGEIHQVASMLEPALDHAIVFDRLPEVKELAMEFLNACTGEYELGGQTLTVFLRGENTLMLNVPGQPDYELTPVKEKEFQIKGLSGYKVIFKQEEDSGKITEVVLNQPNGVFKATRK